MNWEPWERTSDSVEEWTVWDASESWFVSVCREKGQRLWRWHVAYAPGDGDALLEHDSWALTKNRAMQQAKLWAQRHAFEDVPDAPPS